MPARSNGTETPTKQSVIGLVGLAVMGQVRVVISLVPVVLHGKHEGAETHTAWNLSAQNLALNIAEKGFPISVYNRSYEKTELAVKRAGKEGKHQRWCARS